KASAEQADRLAGLEVDHGDFATVLGPYIVVGRDSHLVPGLWLQAIERLPARWEDLLDPVRLAVRADHSRGLADERIDPPPPLARRHQRVTGHARVRRVDAVRRLARVPLLDRVVELHARIGAGPRGLGDVVPELPRLERLVDGAVRAQPRLPGAVLLDGVHERVRHA